MPVREEIFMNATRNFAIIFIGFQDSLDER